MDSLVEALQTLLDLLSHCRHRIPRDILTYPVRLFFLRQSRRRSVDILLLLIAAAQADADILTDSSSYFQLQRNRSSIKRTCLFYQQVSLFRHPIPS